MERWKAGAEQSYNKGNSKLNHVKQLYMYNKGNSILNHVEQLYNQGY